MQSQWRICNKSGVCIKHQDLASVLDSSVDWRVAPADLGFEDLFLEALSQRSSLTHELVVCLRAGSGHQFYAL